MKKLIVLTILMVFGLLTFAQKENGTVFIEHPAMDKVDQLWEAFETGDKASYGDLLADTVMVVFSGNRNLRTREAETNSLDWWAEEFENLKVVTDTPAYADAIDYKESGVWVQDWLRIQGTHTKSGINLDLPVHNLYSFNEEGKITSIHHYAENDVFDAIRNSEATQENGTVYINHPYIVKVRKLVNAYCDENMDEMMKYYTDDAVFINTTMKPGEQNNLEKQKEEWRTVWSEIDGIEMKQTGYPDCIYYAKNDGYVVYSWWVFTATDTESGEKVKFPMMLSHGFNKDGKIAYSHGYWSSNHYE